MKNFLRRLWGGFCRRPLLWLSLILAAGLCAEWLITYWDMLTFFREGVLYTLVEYAVDASTGHTVMTDTVYVLLLMAVNLIFLLRPGAEEPERKAGIRVEWFTLVYCVLRAGTWMIYLLERVSYDLYETDINPTVMTVCGAMLLPAALAYIHLRTARNPLRPRTIYLTIILTALGIAACGLLMVQMLPGMLLFPLCVAIIGIKAIRSGLKMLAEGRQSATADAPPSEEDTPAVPAEEPAALAVPSAEAEDSPPAAEAPVRLSGRRKAVVLSVLAVLALSLFFFCFPLFVRTSFGGDLLGAITILWLVVLFLFLPCSLTLSNIVLLFIRPCRMPPERRDKAEKVSKLIEYITLSWGFFCTLIWTEFNFTDTRWVDWNEQLYNAEVHSPIATWTVPSVAVMMLVSLGGYLVLRLVKPEKLPPLAAVLSIAGLYIGGVLSAVWILQTFHRDPVICLLPFNVILIYIRTVRDAVTRWQQDHQQQIDHRSPVIRFFARLMNNSASWPLVALLLAVPLLGVIIALLTLFGQAPDSVIQAWTQTADWTFSQQIAPPNLHYDEHYLCTVAAGGHRRVVKPIRKGKRHGHEVTVNRQLCVANAFEQLIEERAPRFHSVVRGIYDKYGYPIARHIKTPLAADAVWVLMKPLEWLFLGVLYLFDPKPENRIAVQYPHAPLPDMTKENN